MKIQNYIPPKVSLSDITREYEVELTDKDLNLLLSAFTILDSGVRKISLVADNEGITKVKGDYETVHCRHVKLKHFDGKSYFDTKTECRWHIETSEWTFPCPDHKYSNIKRNLEKAISEVLKLYTVEVKSFDTDIVEYDTNER